MIDLDELERLEREATPTGWTVSDDEPGDVVIWGPDEKWLSNIGNWARQREHHGEINMDVAARQYVEMRDAADGKFIAAMRNATPALLAEVRQLREIATAARETHKGHTRAEDAFASRNALVKLLSDYFATDGSATK